jgi:sulfur relay (sulfurtransferase) DsrF/TusC family protein
MDQTVTVVITRTPFNTIRNSEALRMSVGLTLCEENRVQVVFVGEGVYTLAPLKPEAVDSPETEKHLQTLKLLNCRMVAEKEAVEERLREINPRRDVELMPGEEVFNLINNSRTVIRY